MLAACAAAFITPLAWAEPAMSPEDAVLLGAQLCRAPEINRAIVHLCSSTQPALARRAEQALASWTARNGATARRIAAGCENDPGAGEPADAELGSASLAAGVRKTVEHVAATIKREPAQCARFIDELASPTGRTELRD